MKPRVLHILKDNKVGGVKSVLSGFVNSPLANEFEFKILIAECDLIIPETLKWKPNLIIYHPPCRFKNFPQLVIISQLAQAKVVVHEHGYSQFYEVFNVRNKARFHFMLKLFYGWGNHVVAISQAQRNWMVENHLVKAENVTMINQCPPLGKFLQVPFKSPSSPFVLGAYGRFSDQKGFDVLIKALRLLADQPFKLLIGGEGAQEHTLKTLAHGANNIEFLGRIDDVPAFLNRCDGVVIPSLWEPWGNVCLEAKAAGRPVIASQVDGLPEQLQNIGILVPPNDPQALAHAILNLRELPKDTLLDWIEEGRSSVEENQQAYIAQWRDVILETLAL